jgi:hypothetical protein
MTFGLEPSTETRVPEPPKLLDEYEYTAGPDAEIVVGCVDGPRMVSIDFTSFPLWPAVPPFAAVPVERMRTFVLPAAGQPCTHPEPPGTYTTAR